MEKIHIATSELEWKQLMEKDRYHLRVGAFRRVSFRLARHRKNKRRAFEFSRKPFFLYVCYMDRHTTIRKYIDFFHLLHIQ